MMKKAVFALMLFTAALGQVNAQGDIDSKISGYFALQNASDDTSAFNLLKEVYVMMRDSDTKDVVLFDRYIKIAESYLSYFTLCSPDEEEDKGVNACARLAFQVNQVSTFLLPEALAMRADAKMLTNDLLGSLDDYNAAIKLKNDNANYYMSRAAIHNKLKNYTEALADFNSALTINPTNASAHFNRGIIYRNMKDWANAAAAFNLCIELDNTNLKAYQNKGIAQYFNNDLDASFTTFTELLAIDANNSDAHYYQGMILNKKKDYANAKLSFEKAVAADPTDDKAWFNLGISAFNMQDKATACTAWNKAKELGNDKAQKFIDEQCKPQ